MRYDLVRYDKEVDRREFVSMLLEKSSPVGGGRFAVSGFVPLDGGFCEFGVSATLPRSAAGQSTTLCASRTTTSIQMTKAAYRTRRCAVSGVRPGTPKADGGVRRLQAAETGEFEPTKR